MVDFTKLMSPEARERHFERCANHQSDMARIGKLTNRELIERAELYLKHTAFDKTIAQGDCNYDSVFIHVIVPIMMRRLKMSLGGSDT